MDKKSVNKILGSESSKSSKMKELYVGGMEIKEIAVLLGVRYNFVYNVVSNMCRIDKVELRTVKNGSGESKKDKICKLIEEGKSNVEISSELGVNYNYVFKVRKELSK